MGLEESMTLAARMFQSSLLWTAVEKGAVFGDTRVENHGAIPCPSPDFRRLY